jgi:hypothetical protein
MSFDRLRDRGPYRLIVGDITTDPKERSRQAVRVQVKARDLGTAGGKQPGGG